VKSYAFLFWAYNVVWLGLAGYLVWLIVRLRRVDRRIAALEREREPHR
jgi:CcmD family protein